MFDFSADRLQQYSRAVSHQRLRWPTLDTKGIEVFLRRDDLASTHYSGNKFYKLFFNLNAVYMANNPAVVSFGGAYSNHIHALAAMGQHYDFSTVGIIRGHSPKVLSPTLVDAQKMGMRLLFLSKNLYKNKNIDTFIPLLDETYGDYYVLPEGGENEQGVLGCRYIGQAIEHAFTGDFTVCCAVGTGTTMAGIISGLSSHHPCLGFSALKGEDTLSPKVRQWLASMNCDHQRWQIMTQFHHGGYAKTTPELLSFMATIEQDNNLLLEPVYSAKMLWGVEQLALEGYWPRGTRLVLVHGGGVQGRRGFSLPTTLPIKISV